MCAFIAPVPGCVQVSLAPIQAVSSKPRKQTLGEQMRKIDEQLRALDPAKRIQHDARTQALVSPEAIMNTPRPVSAGRARRPRRLALASALVATAMAALFLVIDPIDSTTQPAFAVTPQPLSYQHDARAADQVLEEIAQHVEELPDERPTAWSEEHFVTEAWSLSTRIDGNQVTSAVIPQRRETWEKPDGSSRWTARTLRPQFQDAEQRRVWEEAGSVGEDPEEWSNSTAPIKASSEEPPSTPEGMEGWLAAGKTSLTPNLALEVVPERFREHVFSPAQKAALLRVLAGVEGMTYEGTTKDRAGRMGQAFSLTSDASGLPNKRTLVFDSSTGSLLAYEEELTTNAGALNVKVPAVINYTTFLTAERLT
ncbi:CU044_5270 family protein [Streptomyces chilikensis]|uniref:CU044_5270 family protein n=1 Tax=Streptomyces chilikensis TaxID=1194079 RepID=A0ABV3EJG7_9ACTN